MEQSGGRGDPLVVEASGEGGLWGLWGTMIRDSFEGERDQGRNCCDHTVCDLMRAVLKFFS